VKVKAVPLRVPSIRIENPVISRQFLLIPVAPGIRDERALELDLLDHHAHPNQTHHECAANLALEGLSVTARRAH
jgi:hypothetical protein